MTYVSVSEQVRGLSLGKPQRVIEWNVSMRDEATEGAEYVLSDVLISSDVHDGALPPFVVSKR